MDWIGLECKSYYFQGTLMKKWKIVSCLKVEDGLLKKKTKFSPYFYQPSLFITTKQRLHSQSLYDMNRLVGINQDLILLSSVCDNCSVSMPYTWTLSFYCWFMGAPLNVFLYIYLFVPYGAKYRGCNVMLIKYRRSCS